MSTTRTVHVRNIKAGDHIVHFGQLHRIYGIGTDPRGYCRVMLELVEDDTVSFDFVLHGDDTVVITILED